MTILDHLLPYQKAFFTNPAKKKIWVSSRQLGKSHTVAGLLVFKALQKKNGLSLCVSVNSRSAAEIISKCKQFAEAVKVMSDGKIDYQASYDQIKFSTGARVISLPSTADSLRGWSASLVALDESAWIYKLDDILQGIAPTLTRDKDAELILTTTPAGKNGPFYELYQEALSRDDWYVQTTTIHDAIRDGLKVDLDSLHSLCPDPDIFAQEYECRFSDELGQFLDFELLDFYDDEPNSHDAIYFAADIGRTHDKTAIVIMKSSKGISYVSDIIMLSECEYQKQLDMFKSLNDTWHFTAGYVDSGGIGSAVAEFANKQISTRVKPLAFTGANKTPMFEDLRSKVFEHKIKFASHLKQLLKHDFQNVSRVVTPSGEVKYIASRDSNGHADSVSALVLAVKAAHDFPANMQKPISVPMPSRFGSFIHRI